MPGGFDCILTLESVRYLPADPAEFFLGEVAGESEHLLADITAVQHQHHEDLPHPGGNQLEVLENSPLSAGRADH